MLVEIHIFVQNAEFSPGDRPAAEEAEPSGTWPKREKGRPGGQSSRIAKPLYSL